MRGTFAPGCGNIKPNTAVSEGFSSMKDHAMWKQESRWWFDDSEVEFEGCDESESDRQAMQVLESKLRLID